MILLVGFSAGLLDALVEVSGSRIGRRPTAERPEVLDVDPVRRRLVGAEKLGVVVLVLGVWGCRLLHGQSPRPRTGRGDLSVIPSPRGGMEFGATGRSVRSFRSGDHAWGGGHDNYDPAPTAVDHDHAVARWGWSRRRTWWSRKA